MNSLIFLLVRSGKNTFLELMRKPAKLILWLVLVGLMIGLFVLTMYTQKSGGAYADLVWLKGALMLLLLIFAVIAVQKGLSNGDVIFDMNDVNLLFVSPVSSRKILMYGILRMAKMALLAGFFILFQSNSLSSNFGVGFWAVFLVLFAFVLAVSLLQIISLLIYSLANGKPKRKRKVRILTAIVFLPLAVSLVSALVRTGDPLLAAENTLKAPVASWTPVVGWAAEGVVSIISGNTGAGLMFFGLIIITGAFLILYIALSNPDYYEDVLVATETTFEKKRGLSEGQINTEAISGKKVKIVGMGIGGLGANTIFYKHWRESFRAGTLGFWGMSSILTVSGVILMSLFLRKAGGNGILVLLQTLMWLQIFLIGTGRGLKELYMHYIYLIPESSFRKILWSNFEIAFKVLAESIVIFLAAGLILRASFLMTLASAAVYVLFSFLLLGINYLSLRWTGADISGGLMILIYMIAVVLIMLPGLAAAIVIGTMVGGMGVLLGMAVLALWELAAGMGCFWLSKGVLHRCDMPVMKTVK
ncbi:hypothetical protein FRZ06_12615 [Anoxybacterium hadale]|uniref:Uncharacterized protein n=1 Tax=Anoxybacterium hadale TaxID=3408580 RepID=A0ACD1ACW4_9FIRM|nr:hypothetical protein FRZ06_12615 [Clostridiales bacterium]